jgi:hypothetical protein
MQYNSLNTMIKNEAAALQKGPVAMIMVEDDVEVDTTLRHHQQAGFKTIIVLMPAAFELPRDLAQTVIRVDYNMSADAAMVTAINTLVDHMDGQWVYYCYNAEYFFHPFCETRNVVEMLSFQTEERRDAMLAYVIDLYSDDLIQNPKAVSLDNAFLDR